MSIKKVEYSKRFISKTYSKDISPHGSPNWEYFQTISNEDIKLRKLITKEFALKSRINSFYWTGEAEGYDGKFNYIFRFASEFPTDTKLNPESNVEYSSIVKIKKAGSSEDINKNCDLELFLLSERFERNIKSNI
jgi:hypothetical protein